MKKIGLESEGVNGMEKNLAGKPKNLENTIEGEINNQINEVKENAKNIQSGIDSLGGKDGLEEILEKNDKEGNSNIFQTTKKIIAAMAAMVAIPAIASLVKPEIIDEIKNFINSSNGETTILISTGILIVAGIAIMSTGKDGIKFKDFFGSNKLFYNNSEDQNKDIPILNKEERVDNIE